MKEYEIYIEDINPCGGARYARKAIIEAEAESPESYVKEHGRLPIVEVIHRGNGDVLIRTGDGKGNFVNYTFTE